MRKESIVTETLAQNQKFTDRCQRVLQVAKQLFQGRPDWVTFFREVLGVNGASRNVFPDQVEYILFEQSPEFADIQTMVASLRNKKASSGGKNEVTRVITVRLPESLHEALKAEAVDHKTSMNKLCISKLLQALIDEEENATQAAAATQAPARQALNPNPAPAQQTAGTQQTTGAPQAPQFRSTFPGQ
jgi:predicted HicB family RNase H-like nuclease